MKYGANISESKIIAVYRRLTVSKVNGKKNLLYILTELQQI